MKNRSKIKHPTISPPYISLSGCIVFFSHWRSSSMSYIFPSFSFIRSNYNLKTENQESHIFLVQIKTWNRRYFVNNRYLFQVEKGVDLLLLVSIFAVELVLESYRLSLENIYKEISVQTKLWLGTGHSLKSSPCTSPV